MARNVRAKCLHCHYVKGIHCRGLCWTCYRHHGKEYPQLKNRGVKMKNQHDKEPTLEDIERLIASRRATMPRDESPTPRDTSGEVAWWRVVTLDPRGRRVMRKRVHK